jgi:hypothetical protein
VEITDGMLLAESLGYARLIVNSGCTEVIEVMKQRGYTHGPAATIYVDCASLARSLWR